jgi:hypothetical protein
MNNDMVIKKTSVWGNCYNAKNITKRMRLMKKKQLLGHYPFIDHYTTYSYKPKTQKGPAREEQTFILSYAYNYDSFANEEAFISKLNDIDLLFHKEKCLYNNMDAYKIIIYENMCPINEIRQHI